MKRVSEQEAMDFFNNGYIVRKFEDTQTFRDFKNLLINLRENQITKEDYMWVTNKSYRERCQDFKPDIYTYNTQMLDLIFDQRVHEILAELTGVTDLMLGFVKLRWNLSGKAYTSWHRDTDYYHAKPKGLTPSIIGLNYYPCLGEVSEPVLSIWPGSHHRMSRSRFRDQLTVWFEESIKMYTSDDEYLIFDTAMIHDLLPVQSPRGSLRIISQFAREFQLGLFPGKDNLHKLYREQVLLK